MVSMHTAREPMFIHSLKKKVQYSCCLVVGATPYPHNEAQLSIDKTNKLPPDKLLWEVSKDTRHSSEATYYDYHHDATGS